MTRQLLNPDHENLGEGLRTLSGMCTLSNCIFLSFSLIVASVNATEVTELFDYVGNGTVGRDGTGSLKQHSGPKQDSGSISPLFPIFTSFSRSLLHHFYLIIAYWKYHIFMIIT